MSYPKSSGRSRAEFGRYTMSQLVNWLAVGPLADVKSTFIGYEEGGARAFDYCLQHPVVYSWLPHCKDYADLIWSAVDEIVSDRIFGDGHHCTICGHSPATREDAAFWWCLDCASARSVADLQAHGTHVTDPIQFILRARRVWAKTHPSMQPPVPQPTPAPVEPPKPEPVKCWKCGKPAELKVPRADSRAWCDSCSDEFAVWFGQQNNGISAPAWLVKQQLESHAEAAREHRQRERWLGNLPGRKPRLLGTFRDNPFDPRKG